MDIDEELLERARARREADYRARYSREENRYADFNRARDEAEDERPAGAASPAGWWFFALLNVFAIATFFNVPSWGWGWLVPASMFLLLELFAIVYWFKTN